MFKKLITPLLIGALVLTSCTGLFDSGIDDKIADIERRVAELESQCAKINGDVAALEAIVRSLQNDDRIVGVSEIVENGAVMGYELVFSKSGKIVITCGKDGVDGKDGKDGRDGQDGRTPVIGVRQGEDGMWYWTIDGEWMTGADGEKISASGKDGQDGVTPKLRIQDGQWSISYDEGATWTDLTPSVSHGMDSIFRSVSQDDNVVYIELADGTIFRVPRAYELSISLESADFSGFSRGKVLCVGYEIHTEFANTVQIDAFSSYGLKVDVLRSTATTGNIRIEAVEDLTSSSRFTVLVTDGHSVIMRTVCMESDRIIISGDGTVMIGEKGGTVELPFLSTTIDVTVSIPDEAKDWLTAIPGIKSLEKHSISLSVKSMQEGDERSAIVRISLKNGSGIEYAVIQRRVDSSIVTLAEATSDKGINLLIMGDGFIDEDILSGKYDAVMRKAHECFFGVEPFTSYRNCFNVKYMNVVSETRNAGSGSGTAFLTKFGSGTRIDGDDRKRLIYAEQVFCLDDLIKTVVIIVLNSTRHAGTTCMYTNEVFTYGNGFAIFPKIHSDSGEGYAVAYVTLEANDEMFAHAVQHEAGGHGFGKLGDEYVMYSGEMSASSKDTYCDYAKDIGWYKNIDYVSDPAKVKWASFIGDPAYGDIGVYEGGQCYAKGVYRSTEDSIMRSASSVEFNAPSREAIWYRINHLAYGMKWNEGTHAEFVKWDTAKRAAGKPMTRSIGSIPEGLEPFAPPVIL